MGFKLPKGWKSIGNGWVIVPDHFEKDPNYDEALTCANGSYQESLLDGDEAWSGSTLQGRRKKYRSQYALGLRLLAERMRAAGVVFSFKTIDRRKVLILGTLPDPPAPEPEFNGVINNIADLLGAVS